MSDTPYVRLNDLFRSSHMRLATLVAGAVFACYLLAGRIAYGVLGAEPASVAVVEPQAGSLGHQHQASRVLGQEIGCVCVLLIRRIWP